MGFLHQRVSEFMTATHKGPAIPHLVLVSSAAHLGTFRPHVCQEKEKLKRCFLCLSPRPPYAQRFHRRLHRTQHLELPGSVYYSKCIRVYQRILRGKHGVEPRRTYMQTFFCPLPPRKADIWHALPYIKDLPREAHLRGRLGTQASSAYPWQSSRI